MTEKTSAPKTRKKPGVWVAHIPSAGGAQREVAVFSAEIEALRYANQRRLDVTYVEFGQTLGDALGNGSGDMPAL